MNKNDDDDKQAFQEAMRGITPLSRKEKVGLPRTPRTKSKPGMAQTYTSSRKPVSSLDAPRPMVIKPQPYQPDVGADDSLSYRDPSLNELSWRRFKTGQLKWELRLDLHGLTLLDAEQALETLMQRAQAENAHHLLIIHGKGSHDGNTPPALKNWLWRWLRNEPRVLAIHSTPRHQGGTGAVLVWLKRY